MPEINSDNVSIVSTDGNTEMTLVRGLMDGSPAVAIFLLTEKLEELGPFVMYANDLRVAVREVTRWTLDDLVRGCDDEIPF